MFRHSVLFRFSPESTTEQVDALAAGLRTLPAQIPEIRSYQVGPNVGDEVENWHFAVVADFDNVDDWRSYANHPIHRAVVADFVHPILADRAVVQYEL
jgi:hypothetical protein